MKRAVALLMYFALALPLYAQPATEARADVRVSTLLDELGLEYQIDDDADFRSIFNFDGEKRSQMVYVNSKTAQYDGIEMREVWSPALESDGALS
ncbi:MAG: hypothetical protein H7X80_04195, partial [bacterium]|nr:hypothetical protein [Candidatus Kapabacteria bacterium]